MTTLIESNNSITKFIEDVFAIIGSFYRILILDGFRPVHCILIMILLIVVFWMSISFVMGVLRTIFIPIISVIDEIISSLHRNRLIKNTYAQLGKLAILYLDSYDRTPTDLLMIQEKSLDILLASGMTQDMMEEYLKCLAKFETDIRSKESFDEESLEEEKE